MITLYFCLDDNAPIMRIWPFVPRTGDYVSIPELGGSLNRLKVYEVCCEGYENPSVSVYLHQARGEHEERPTLDGDGHARGKLYT